MSDNAAQHKHLASRAPTLGALKRFARDYLITDKTHQLITYYRQHRSHALHQLDKVIIEHFDGKRDGYYVEIGANDGVSQSNTLKLEREYGWRGTLIEPSLNNYEKCLKNRSIKNHITCCACVADDCEDTFVELVYLDLMTFGKRSISEREEHIKQSQRYMPHIAPVPFMAQPKTMTQILNEAHAPKDIDLLSLDVEGAELDVLKGLDFERYRFSALVIECWDRGALETYLKPKGYRFQRMLTHVDALFIPCSGETL